jgi:hypothetical protein
LDRTASVAEHLMQRAASLKTIDGAILVIFYSSTRMRQQD